MDFAKLRNYTSWKSPRVFYKCYLKQIDDVRHALVVAGSIVRPVPTPSDPVSPDSDWGQRMMHDHPSTTEVFIFWWVIAFRGGHHLTSWDRRRLLGSPLQVRPHTHLLGSTYTRCLVEFLQSTWLLSFSALCWRLSLIQCYVRYLRMFIFMECKYRLSQLL